VTKIPILITAIGGGGHGEQILKAVRLASSERYWIVGADANPRCPQFDSVDEKATLPFANDPQYMDALLSICDQYGIQALFHGCEPELKIFSRERHRIEAAGIFLPVNSSEVIDIGMDKAKTSYFLKDNGFQVLKFREVITKKDIEAVDFFPVVVKPAVGSGGSANCFIAQDSKELKALATLLHLDESIQKFLVQEYVGRPEEEYTVGVLHDMDGQFINSIAVHRLLNGQLHIRLSVPNRTQRKELGPKLVISSGVSHGYVDRFPEVTGQCEAIARALNVRGPVNIQCRLVRGKVMVFEINPRFSGTTSIRALKGYNEPDILLRKHLLGEKIKVGFQFGKGLVLRSLTETVIED